MYSLLLLSVCSLVLIRWAVSFHPYSGAGKAPMFGDFEAQRHWMEITYHLPYSEWYRNGSNNNLLYWGLDYPPLTAYHSWLCGYLSNKINASWVELLTSRGLEDSSHKLFMRASVLLPDVLIFMSSILFYFFKCDSSIKNDKEKLFSATLMLLYPGLILVDHGHFQYNCISLGLMVWAVNHASLGRSSVSSVLFVMALNYKQMELYHSAPFFFFFLGNIISSNCSSFKRFVMLSKIGAVVIGTFLLIWLPFLSSVDSVSDVIGRLFPFGRGLFEDKVSNFWCTLSTFVKIRRLLSAQSLIKLCISATLISCLPSMISLLFSPSFRQFRFSLVNCSLAFFLFSYQVHEKSILLPAGAAMLLFSEKPLSVLWFLAVSTFSMLPLFVKDDLVIPFISCFVIFAFSSTMHPSLNQQNKIKTPARVLLVASIVSMTTATLLSLCVHPPANLPDIFTVLVSTISCIHFLFFFVFFNASQILFEKHLVEKKDRKEKVK